MKELKIKVPFIDHEIIRAKAGQFLEKYWGKSVPVDIEKIIAVKLRMDVIPVSGIKDDFDVDALIISDWSGICVDLKSLTNDKLVNRLRFSLAHEIGHYVLHKKIYESFQIVSEEDFYKFYELLPQEEYSKFEIQAFIFAGYLLVPRDVLKKEKELVMKKVKDINLFDRETLQVYLASYLSKKFGISFVAMQSILNFDNRNNR